MPSPSGGQAAHTLLSSQTKESAAWAPRTVVLWADDHGALGGMRPPRCAWTSFDTERAPSGLAGIPVRSAGWSQGWTSTCSGCPANFLVTAMRIVFRRVVRVAVPTGVLRRAGASRCQRQSNTYPLTALGSKADSSGRRNDRQSEVSAAAKTSTGQVIRRCCASPLSGQAKGRSHCGDLSSRLAARSGAICQCACGRRKISRGSATTPATAAVSMVR